MRFLLLFAFIVLLLLTILLGRQVRAENWMRAEELQAGMVRGFELRSSCEAGGFKCLEIGDERPDELNLNVLEGGEVELLINAEKKAARLAAEAEADALKRRMDELARKEALTMEEMQEAIQVLLGAPVPQGVKPQSGFSEIPTDQ